jgi:hypothetical protein
MHLIFYRWWRKRVHWDSFALWWLIWLLILDLLFFFSLFIFGFRGWRVNRYYLGLPCFSGAIACLGNCLLLFIRSLVSVPRCTDLSLSKRNHISNFRWLQNFSIALLPSLFISLLDFHLFTLIELLIFIVIK